MSNTNNIKIYIPYIISFYFFICMFIDYANDTFIFSGVVISHYLKYNFGLIGVLSPLIILFIYRNYNKLQHKKQKAFASIGLVFSILLLQALVIHGALNGYVSIMLAYSLLNVLNVGFLWIFAFLIFFSSLYVLLYDNKIEISAIMLNIINLFDKYKNNTHEVENINTAQKDEVVSCVEFGNTAQIIIKNNDTNTTFDTINTQLTHSHSILEPQDIANKLNNELQNTIDKEALNNPNDELDNKNNNIDFKLYEHISKTELSNIDTQAYKKASNVSQIIQDIDNDFFYNPNLEQIATNIPNTFFDEQDKEYMAKKQLEEESRIKLEKEKEQERLLENKSIFAQVNKKQTNHANDETNNINKDENTNILNKQDYKTNNQSLPFEDTKQEDTLSNIDDSTNKSTNTHDINNAIQTNTSETIKQEQQEKENTNDDPTKSKKETPQESKESTNQLSTNNEDSLPLVDFFKDAPTNEQDGVAEELIDSNIENLLEKLKVFKINGDVIKTYTGPIVTTFEFKPTADVKVSKILGLQDDLAMALSAPTIRIQAPIPGKDVVGIEVPNKNSSIIYMKEMLSSDDFTNHPSNLAIILGKDIVGRPYVTDLAKLPHLLIAGTTGSGKSVGINAMILSLLYKNTPQSLRMVMIDPKMIEFSMYDGIAHLLAPVIVDANEAINALANMVAEMERRYKLMSTTKTKNIENYNKKAKIDPELEELPYIVIIIDELADLMMTSGKEVEISIARLAQKARACGMHLIVATQRPSVDVVTGLIKANFPSRLSYKVGTKTDSKVILDVFGAESLLGRGDLLFTPPGEAGLRRLHAPWSEEGEIEDVVEFIKAQYDTNYDMSILQSHDEKKLSNSLSNNREKIDDVDELYDDAVEIILRDKKTSISYLQRKLNIGYNRSATIIDQLEANGVLSAPNTKGNRNILIDG